MATDKILDLEVFDVDSTGKCTADGGFAGVIGGDSQSLSTNVGADIQPTTSLVFVTSTDASSTFTIADGLDGQKISIINTNTNAAVIRTAGTYGTDVQLNTVGEWAEYIFSEDESEWIILGTTGVIS